MEQEQSKPAVTNDDVNALFANYSKPSIEVKDQNQNANPDLKSEPDASAPPVDAETVSDPDAPYGRFANGSPRKRRPKGTAAPTVTVNKEKLAEPAKISGIIIDGALGIMIIDLLLPLLIAYGNNALSKEKVDPKELKMKPDQKAEVKLILDKVLGSIDFNVHPGWALAIALPGVYAMNLFYAKMMKKVEMKKETKQ